MKLERQKKGGLKNFENLPIKKGLIFLTSQFCCAAKVLIQCIHPCERGKKSNNLHGFCPQQCSHLLTWGTFEVGCGGLLMGLLILAILTALFLLPYLLGLVVDPQQHHWVTSDHDVFNMSSGLHNSIPITEGQVAPSIVSPSLAPMSS